MREYGLYINGEWIKSSTGRSFMTKNPANGETLAFIAQGSKKDVDKAVEASIKALPMWKKFPPPKRGEILLNAAAIM